MLKHFALQKLYHFNSLLSKVSDIRKFPYLNILPSEMLLAEHSASQTFRYAIFPCPFKIPKIPRMGGNKIPDRQTGGGIIFV